ncbi:response regulator [Patescibacteria group bacterium]|nr:response regulator [Patescibacteria group bacterium]
MDIKKILIIEDDTNLQSQLAGVFKDDGFQVTLAGDGGKGLMLALVEHPDMILLDIILPKMDGITMLKKLRKDEWGKNVPVIILSNLDTVEDLSKAMEGGAFKYLVKTDWELKDIVIKVKEALK